MSRGETGLKRKGTKKKKERKVGEDGGISIGLETCAMVVGSKA